MTAEVTAADIARIAGVGRAAVSNWRRRHADFPAPVGGPATSPTFALADIQAWLAANGRTTGANTTEARHAPVGLPGADLAAELATTLVALAPPLSEGVVLDPACGDGTLLSAAAARYPAHIRYIGLDPDPQQAHHTPTRLAGHDPGAVEIRTGAPGATELARWQRHADVVVSVTPAAGTAAAATEQSYEFGPPARPDHALGWVQVCFSLLRPGGTAVVAVPFAVAVRASGRRIRAELLRAGVLTHVIALPERIATAGQVGPWQVWLLTRPAERPGYVLRMVDLVDTDLDDLPRNPAGWAGVYADPARTRDVPAIELLDEDVLLTPAAHVVPAVRDVTGEYTTARHRYHDTAVRLAATAPVLRPARGHDPAPLVSVGDLARSGALTLVARDDLRPGDVLVAGVSGFDATVVADGHTDPGGATVIRCDPEVLDPFYLACFLRSEHNRRQAAGTMGGTFRLDVRRARVPNLPLTAQRRYGETFRRLMEFAAHAEQVAASASDAVRTAVYGLTAGVFAPAANTDRTDHERE